jgi:predicted acyltransferase (DUF342 family)
MMLILACTLLVLLLILPFVPGTRELIKRRDAAPLYINIDYHKDPRYFAVSCKKLFLGSLKTPITVGEVRDVMLSKEEKVQIVGTVHVPAGSVIENILYVVQHLESETNVSFEKEIYVRGTARIGENNRLQALACDGDIHLMKGTKFFRWLDAEGSITVEGPCALGVGATCSGMLSLTRQCTFMKLYGFPVSVNVDPALLREDDTLGGESVIASGSLPLRDCSAIPASSRLNCDIISSKSMTIGEHAVIQGHIKTHGNLVIGAHVTIVGNIFAEGSIEIGLQSRVMGTIFSQERVLLKQGVRVGAKNRIKSVIGKKSVALEDNVIVYGFIMTEGMGVVV